MKAKDFLSIPKAAFENATSPLRTFYHNVVQPSVEDYMYRDSLISKEGKEILSNKEDMEYLNKLMDMCIQEGRRGRFQTTLPSGKKIIFTV
ncbi:hypothetical protein V6R21_07785 [Limibacter armeniacum]|uniref:hypothetical protein n=1 Tax=Limibacter armeniacum TaxID=466084 RepID=UPI002FE50FB2